MVNGFIIFFVIHFWLEAFRRSRTNIEIKEVLAQGKKVSCAGMFISGFFLFVSAAQHDFYSFLYEGLTFSICLNFFVWIEDQQERLIPPHSNQQ